MRSSEIREKILSDSDFVTNEITKLIGYYQLKHTPRWGYTHRPTDAKESVADHIFGMHLLASYFLPLHTDHSFNVTKITEMITWHDMAESVVGDTTKQTKTKGHEDNEKQVEKELVENASFHIFKTLYSVFTEYEEQKTNEAKFVKAIDKLEPMFQMYFVTQSEYATEKNMEWPADEYRTFRKKYLSDFPILDTFDNVLDEKICHSGFFPKKA